MTEREDSYIGGTIAGGKAAAETNKNKYGQDYYAKIGKIGGGAGTTGGFYYSKNHGLTTHIEAGRLGGLKSKRKPRNG